MRCKNGRPGLGLGLGLSLSLAGLGLRGEEDNGSGIWRGSGPRYSYRAIGPLAAAGGASMSPSRASTCSLAAAARLARRANK